MNALLAPSRRAEQSVAPVWPRKYPPQIDASQTRQASRIVQLCSRERSTCETWVLEHRNRLIAVARRILRCEEDAADAVQDAFLSAFASLHRFQAKSQVYTWLHRIVVNVCLMKLRSQQTRRVVSLDALLPTCADSDVNNQSFSKPTYHGCDHLEREETRAVVHRCIDCLSEAYREILVLRDLQELDTDTTARLLGISRTAAKTRLHRARQALRAQLEITRFTVTSQHKIHPTQ